MPGSAWSVFWHQTVRQFKPCPHCFPFVCSHSQPCFSHLGIEYPNNGTRWMDTTAALYTEWETWERECWLCPRSHPALTATSPETGVEVLPLGRHPDEWIFLSTACSLPFWDPKGFVNVQSPYSASCWGWQVTGPVNRHITKEKTWFSSLCPFGLKVLKSYNALHGGTVISALKAKVSYHDSHACQAIQWVPG